MPYSLCVMIIILSEETLKSIISIDPCCPYEFVPNLSKLVGERRLLVGVLERGIKDAAGMFDVTTQKPGSEQSAAVYWMMSKEDDVMSFEWICAELDLDADSVREGTLALIKQFKSENREHLFEHRRRSCAS